MLSPTPNEPLGIELIDFPRRWLVIHEYDSLNRLESAFYENISASSLYGDPYHKAIIVWQLNDWFYGKHTLEL